MKGAKRILSGILAAVMVMGGCTGGAFAKEPDPVKRPVYQVALAGSEHGYLTFEDGDTKTRAFAGEDEVRVCAVVETGYMVESYTVASPDEEPAICHEETQDLVFSFSMPHKDVTVTAAFVPAKETAEDTAGWDRDEAAESGQGSAQTEDASEKAAPEDTDLQEKEAETVSLMEGAEAASETLIEADSQKEAPEEEESAPSEEEQQELAEAEAAVQEIAEDVQDAISDPVIENYIREHVDRAYSDFNEEEFGMVNIMTVRQTLFDASLVQPEDTIDSILGSIEEDAESPEFDKLIAQFSNYNIPLYNLSADSDYLVAMADTMVDQKNSSVREAAFAYTNNRGQELHNCHYDLETGLAYIPKSEMFSGEEYRVNCVQVQLMQLLEPETESVVIPAISTKESADEAEAVVTKTDLIETVTTVDVAKDLDEDHLVVTVNGYPEAEEEYSYDAKEGTITINEYPATVQSVVVTEEKETLGDKIDDLARSLHLLNDAYAMSADDMQLLGDPVTLPSWVQKGTLVTGTVAFNYTGNQGWSGSYEYNGDPSAVMNAVNSGTIDMSKVNKPGSGAFFTVGLQFAAGVPWDTNYGETVYSMASDLTKGLDLSEWGYLSLECDHIVTDLGTTTNAQTRGGKWYPGNVKIRFFDINESKGYAIVGIYTCESHNQSGFGILKMAIGVANGTVSIGKKGATTGDQIAGATYYVYTTCDCTTYANDVNGSHTFVTTANAAPNCSNILTYPAGTYYVRESSSNLPAGTEWNSTVYSFTISPGSHVYAGGGWVKDNEFGSGYLVKKSTEDGSIVPGAVYGIYTDAACKTAAKTTAGNTATFTTTATGSNTVNLRPGTYYIKETKAAPGYRLSPTVYTKTITRGKTTEVDVTNEPNTGYMYVLKASDEPDITKANAAYSLEGAEYGLYASKDDAKSDKNRMETLVTDKNGKTRTVELKSGDKGITYYVKELKPSAGFLLCDGSDGSDHGIHEVTIHTDETKEVRCTEPLATAEFPLELQKYDAETGKAEAQGSASLEGGIFAVEFWNNCTGSTKDEPDAVWYYRTDEKGNFHIRDEKYLVKTYTFGQSQSQTAYAGRTITSSPLNKDKNGRIFFYMGTYRVKEICPPELYQLKGSIRLESEADSKAAPVQDGCVLTIDYDSKNHTAQYKRSGSVIKAENLAVHASDYVHLGVLTITKYGDSKKPLPGVQYKLVWAEDGSVIDIRLTGNDGIALFEKLIPGDYILTEVATADGYDLLKENIEIHIPCQMTEEELKDSHADVTKSYFDEASQTFCFEKVNFDITDSAEFDMPMAGGNTTALYLGLIAAFAMIGAGLMFAGRRKVC